MATSLSVSGFAGASHGPLRRVTFGSGYARESIFECFVENEQHYPILLPMHFDEGPDQMSHLRLQNGTIWRWNRPLIGFDYDGIPHLRIEHRVVPGGPTVSDVIANAALYFGLMEAATRFDPEKVPPDRRERLMANDFRAIAAAQQDRPSMAEALPRMGMPCLVYAGTADAVHEQAEQAAAELSDGRFVPLPDLDHGAAFRESGVILPVALDFLGRS